MKYAQNHLTNYFTLSLLGYLKTWIPCVMTNDTSLESSYALLEESARKLQICKNRLCFTKFGHKLKRFAKKCPQMIKYKLLKNTWTMPYQICKKNY